MSTFSLRWSTILPFPSSPHWAPTMTWTGIRVVNKTKTPTENNLASESDKRGGPAGYSEKLSTAFLTVGNMLNTERSLVITKRLSSFLDAPARRRSPPAFFTVERPLMSMLSPELFIVWTPPRSMTIRFFFFSASLWRRSLRAVASGPPSTLPSSRTTVTPPTSLLCRFIVRFSDRGCLELLGFARIRVVEHDGAGDVNGRVGAGDNADGHGEGKAPVHLAAE